MRAAFKERSLCLIHIQSAQGQLQRPPQCQALAASQNGVSSNGAHAPSNGVAKPSSSGSSPSYWDKIQETAAFIRARGAADPEFVIVLGSGLGVIAEDLEDQVVIPYSEIPHFHAPGVQGHAGRLVLGKMQGVPVMVLQVSCCIPLEFSGRVHLEGFSRRGCRSLCTAAAEPVFASLDL